MKKYVIIAACALVACSSDDDSSNNANNANNLQLSQELLGEVATNYSEIVKASYEDSITAAQALDTAIETFTDTPNDDNLEAAKQAWLDSREPYLQTEVYRFYDGPIDNPENGPEGLLNAWPLDENYIDYVEGDPDSGIVQDDSITIDGETLESLNEVDNEKNIATGYHAIEFLLWGQDLSDAGPGARPVSDYEDSNAFAIRRKSYLNTASVLLLEHLGQVDAAWADGAEYRTSFEADPDDALRKILTGMIVLSGFETGGERLQTALDSGEQEDEHSCFSDNTHRDMIQDVQGVQNVYLGTYTRLDGSTVSGKGVRDAIAELDPELAQELEDKIADSLALANALPTPFDQAIATDNSDGRAAVEALIISLREQEDLLEEAFRLFGYDIPVVE